MFGNTYERQPVVITSNQKISSCGAMFSDDSTNAAETPRLFTA